MKPHILESISNLQENCKCHCGVNSISKRMLSGVADTHMAMDLTAMQFHNVKEYNCRTCGFGRDAKLSAFYKNLDELTLRNRDRDQITCHLHFSPNFHHMSPFLIWDKWSN